MSECEFMQGCHWRTQVLHASPGLAKEYEDTYCKDKYSKCARYAVASECGPDKVPLDLLPLETARAVEAIEGIRKWSSE